MSRRRYRKGTQSRFSGLFVCLVVTFLIVVVSFKCVELKAKNQEYTLRQEELQTQIEEQTQRAEELKQLKKYIQTDSYVEEIAAEKLGFVREGEIVFRTTK